ncbi:MAG: 50S ribosomal protein L19 [Bdellovibrionota bacterium]
MAKKNNWLKKFEDFNVGDTVKVYVRIKEGEKERTQLYSGLVIKSQGSGLGKTFTVRKISAGVGVERTFPYASPAIEKVEVVSSGKTRRGRLYFVRDLKGRAARLKAKTVAVPVENTGGAAPAEEAAPDKA